MIIHGLQKLTLLDFPGHTACTIFTGGCNYRCPFCHNASLVTDIHSSEEISLDSIIEFLKKRIGILDGVAITGGEPLMQSDIAEFITEIHKMGYLVKLDTNGSYPGKLSEIIENKIVDYIAMDIKNSPALYGKTIGRNDITLDNTYESINLIMSSKIEYEFRTTVVKELHTIDSIIGASQMIAGAKKYFLQNFVDSGHLIEDGYHSHSKEMLLKMKDAAELNVPNVSIRGI